MCFVDKEYLLEKGIWDVLPLLLINWVTLPPLWHHIVTGLLLVGTN